MSKEVIKLNANTIVGIDSRGFIFASAIAYKLKKKLVMIRKKGKLPGKTFMTSYKLEYGSNQLEIQSDMIKSSDKVVIIDDIFATSGTIRASMKLIEKTISISKEEGLKSIILTFNPHPKVVLNKISNFSFVSTYDEKNTIFKSLDFDFLVVK